MQTLCRFTAGDAMTISNAAGRFGSGRAVKRVEDAALLAGKGLFVDNVGVEGQPTIAFSSASPYAHARIRFRSITTAALAMPGVLRSTPARSWSRPASRRSRRAPVSSVPMGKPTTRATPRARHELVALSASR